MDVKSNPYQDIINDAAAKNGIDVGFLTQLLKVESGFNPNAKSPKGPKGIAQFTKATGAKYGLVKDEDFYNPDKSINAAAAHIKDLLQSNNRDYVRTALAYNQGEGTAGQPQLQAYDSGDYTMISNEGQKYIKNFRDWDNGSNQGRTIYLYSNTVTESNYKPIDNTSTGDINIPENPLPKTVMEGATKNDIKSDPNNFPKPTMVSLSGSEAPAQVPNLGSNYEVDMFNATGKTVQEVENPSMWNRITNAGETIGDYAAKAPGAGIYRAIKYSPEGTVDYLTDRIRSGGYNDYVPDDADFAYARSKGIVASNYSMLEGASSKDGWKYAVDEAARVQGIQGKIDNSDSTTGHIVGFVTDIALDPVSYIPVGGIALKSVKGLKLANAALVRASEGAAFGLGSAYTHQTFSGEEAHYATATVFGAVLGGGFGVFENRFMNKGTNEIVKSTGRGQEDAAQAAADGFSDAAISSSQRIESRESAATLNGQRLDLLPPDPNTTPAFVGENGQAFWNHPHDPDAVVTANGEVIQGGDMLNPKTMSNVSELLNGEIPSTSGNGSVISKQQQLTEIGEGSDKAFAVNLKGFTEIGNSMGLSDDNFVRGLGSQLFRPTMTTGGTQGLAKTTSADIIQRLKGTDNMWSSKYDTLRSAALDDIKYAKNSNKQEALDRNIVEAIEDRTNTKLNMLSESERNLAEHVRSNFAYKEDLMLNPAQLGNIDAVPILSEKTFNSGNYTQRFYNPSKIMDLKERIRAMAGVAEKDVETIAKDSVKKSFMQSYLKDAVVRAELDKRVFKEIFGSKVQRLTRPVTTDYATTAEYNAAKKSFEDQTNALNRGVEEHVEKLAYGVIHNGDDNSGALVLGLYGHGDSAVTVNHVDFLKERSPLGSDEVIQLPDGSSFSVNDIRDFELHTIIPAYNSNVMHKIAVNGVGLEETELRDLVNSNYERLLKAGKKNDAHVLMNGYKVITGQSRRQNGEGLLDNLFAAAQSATFGARNTYMGMLNVTEVQKMIGDSSWRTILDNVPIMRDIFAWNTKQGRETLQSMHDYTFGKYIDDTFRPRYKDYVGSLTANPNTVENQTAIKAVSGLRVGADAFAYYNPGTWLLRETTNGIVHNARKVVMADIIRNVFENKNLPRYLKEEKLNALSITPDQVNDIKSLITDHIQYNGKGSFELKDVNKWVADPRTSHLFRLGDNYANRVILRPETISSAMTTQFPRALNLLTQFKMFSVRSVNGKFMSMVGDSVFNRQYMDNAMQLVLSMGLAGMGYAGQTYGLANTMPEEKRDEYLAQAFNNSNFMWNVLSRSSVVGGPIGLASSAYTIATGSGPGQYLRSTVTPDILQKDDGAIFKGSASQNPSFLGAGGRLIQQVPALSYTANLLAAPYYTARMLASDEYFYDHSDYATAAFNNWRGVLPNNPLTYMFLDQIFRTQGLDTDYLRNH